MGDTPLPNFFGNTPPRGGGSVTLLWGNDIKTAKNARASWILNRVESVKQMLPKINESVKIVYLK